jgi:hypothetical protein
VQQQRERERGGEPERDRDRREHERVRERGPEDVVGDELAEVVEAGVLRGADQVVLGQREPERQQRRQHDERADPDEVRRQHQPDLPALA